VWACLKISIIRVLLSTAGCVQQSQLPEEDRRSPSYQVARPGDFELQVKKVVSTVLPLADSSVTSPNENINFIPGYSRCRVMFGPTE
jgi:hypothetical protein